MTGAAGVPWLVELTRDERVSVRRDAARALGDIGLAASSAVPALEELAARPFDDSVAAAYDALAVIRPKGPRQWLAKIWYEISLEPAILFLFALALLVLALLRLHGRRPLPLATLLDGGWRRATPFPFLVLQCTAGTVCLCFAAADLAGERWTLHADTWALFVGTALVAGALHDFANSRQTPASS